MTLEETRKNGDFKYLLTSFTAKVVADKHPSGFKMLQLGKILLLTVIALKGFVYNLSHF